MASKFSSFDNFYKTFSGADTLVFIVIPNTKPITLGSLSTISYSTYRVKKPVTLLSRINVAGYTRGQRTVAGTLIFTLINQHWVNEVIDAVSCLGQFENLKPDELPLFDLMMVSANEYGSGVVGYIYGVDVTDDTGVISVNDMYTETTVSFLARDIDLLKDYMKTVHQEVKSGYQSVENYSISLVEGNPKIFKLKNTKQSKEEVNNINNNNNSDNNNDSNNVNNNDINNVNDNNNIHIINNVLNINDMNLDDELYTFNDKSKINIFTKSYYQNEYNRTFLNNIESNNVTYNDIISSLVFDNNNNSYPKLVDCLLRKDNEIIKIHIKIESSD